jgi:CRP/FNR family transcriptional regulator
MAEFARMLKCKNTMGRIACAISEVAKKYGFDEYRCINVRMTRKDISELSGTTTESAIRILNELKREKVINFINGRICILDQERLLQKKSATGLDLN